ncbi:hypothetical protein MN608_11864 [Microdochium nivale]|nr:hypothetical protein MN608_11864 [Microdochium nivale]
MEPQASVSSDDGSDNDGDDSDGDDSDGDNDDDDNDDDDDSDGDDDDWDTGSLITSNRHYARGLSITNTDRSWVDRLCKLVTAAYNDWSDWTAAAREPGSTRPSHRKKPSRKRPREERRETSGPQHSRKKSNEQRKRSKRTAEDMEGDSLNNDDSDGNDGDGDGGGREALPASSDDSKRKFACPFYKSNNKRYAECLRFRFTRVSDVKQHLRRVHMRPLFCYLCGEEFTLQDENGLEAHARALDCEKKDFEKPDGITQGQIKWLGYRGPKGSTLIDQWYLGIWDVVFPGKARPDTPFVLTAADEVRQDLVSRFESKWPEFMSEYFESHPQSISSNGVAPLDIEQVSKLFTTMQLELLNRLVLESMQTDDKGNTPYEDVESTITTNQEAVLQHASPLTTTAAGDVATPDDSIEVDAEAEPFRGNTTQYLFDLAQENPATLGGGTVEAESFNSYASEQTMGHNHGAQDSDLQEYEPSELFDDAWLQYP